jgi:hypothetical protein
MLNKHISIFKNVKSTTPYDKTVGYFLDRIKNGSPATENVLKYRETEDKKYKMALPAATFSGTFSYRAKDKFISFSQLACLDFDKFTTEQQAIDYKNEIIKDEHCFSAFISPSGKGVKALFKLIDSLKDYESLYLALCKKFDNANLDSNTKDISRLCLESYDPDIYVNENAKEWSKLEVSDYNELSKNTYDVIVPLRSESRIIDLLQTWFDKKFSVSEGGRNDSIYRFASAMNCYGINEITATSYLSKYAQKGFTAKEIEQSVNSAYKRLKSEFNTKAFEDIETKQQLQKSISNGKSISDIKKQLEKTRNPIISDNELFEEILENIKTEENETIFWDINDKGKLNLVPHKFDIYFKSNNIMKYYPESGQETFIFVSKNNNLIEATNRDKIKDFVLKDLKYRPNIGYAPFDFMSINTKFFSNEFLNMIESVDIQIKKDTSDKCFLYYKNCVVEVGVNYTKVIDYIDMDKCVWKDSVIDRDFTEYDHHGGEFRSFIWYISGEDKHSYNCFKSAIGYLLHSYKTQADNKAIILNDEMISDEPNGRSGKGVFFNGIKQLKKLVSLNGKKLDLNSQFAFQTVKADCQVLVFDDVKRNFPFEDLFSIITEGLEIEYKGQGAIKLPVTKSPKIVITTNYTIKGQGGSFDARKHELELSSHFNSSYSPRDKFGHMLFDDWSNDEWCKFDNFMIQCIQYYLEFGLQKQVHKNLEVRKYIGETCQDFYDWTQDGAIQPEIRYYNNETFNKFTSEFPDHLKNNLRIKTFKKWVKTYAEINGLNYGDGTSNGNRYFFLSKNKISEQDLNDPF